MYCIASDPEPALHSQLGKTDGEVTNLVSCDASVLHTRSPQGRSASGCPPFEPQGRAIPVGLSSGPARGVARWFSGLGRYGDAGSRRHVNVPKRGV